MKNSGIQVIPGYGESVRRQLEQIGWNQTELAERSGVSRQTISRALNHDEVSARTAERIAAALGQVSARSIQPRPGSASREPKTRNERPRPTGSGLCDASDLVAWAGRREAQALLPKVVRRLVLATGNTVTEAHFRADEGVQLSGWDGIVRADGSAPFVPAGPSGWEMGTGAQPRSKAEGDLAKRTKKSGPLRPAETTFMFVTLRRWEDKDSWAKEKTNEGPWRQVRVLDADDLASWLETAPAVHTWLSILIGKTPPGAIDLETYWETWSEATRPAVSPALLLAGRDEAAAEIRDRLSDSDQPFAIRAESRSESIAALFAAVNDLPAEEAEAVLARAVVVESAEALRQLTGSSSPLLLIPTFDSDEFTSAAARAGHTVVVPLGAGDPQPQATVQLPPLSRRRAADALAELGIDRDRAYDMAGLARRSFTAFRRAVASSPGLRQPKWAEPAVGRSLLPALFAGAWNGAMTRDRETLAALGRRPYEEVQDELIPWAVGSDPAVRRRGDTWYLVSREDAWRLLARYITSDDLERFEQAVMTVLGTPHPRFDLPVEQRWMAGALGHSAPHSGLLARGLAETLAVMGVLGEGVPSAGRSARDTAEQVVQRLLEAANEDWRLWASLSPHLQLLAEAAPDAFLDGVEDGLSGRDPVLGRMFTDEKHVMFGSSPHTGLLWALEALAWSRPHLGRVVQLLARMDRIDPGSELRDEDDRTGRLSNRPLASLKAIFRSWLPETAASLEERLRALDRLRTSQSNVAWAVMLSMLPEHHATAFPSAKPSFRDWALEARQATTYREIAVTTKEVVNRLREDAGTSGTRWAELVEQLPMLPPEEYEAVAEDLEALDLAALAEADRTAIWSGLRELVSRHRAFSSAKWAMPEEYVQRLADLRRRFAPSDPIALYGWLFGHDPYLPDGEDVLETSWEAREEALRSERVKAVEAILTEDGVNVLIALAEQVDNPFALGHAAGSTDASLPHTDRLLSLLANPSPSLAQLASGFAAARRQTYGDEWVVNQLQRTEAEFEPEQQAALLHVLPATPDTWRLAHDRGEAVWLAYWRGVNVYALSREHLVEATSALLEAGRPFAAVDLLGLSQRQDATVSPELIADVIEAAISEPEQDRPSSHFAYSVGELLDLLHKASFDETRLARLEWALLPILDRHNRRPKILHRLLSASPDFFVEVLSLVYRAEGEEPAELSQEDQQRARLGYSLLQEWRTVPGQQDNGAVDADHLREWIGAARERLQEVGRYTVGLHTIGQVLSGSPADPDGTWPCAAVRDIIEDLASSDLEEGIRIGVYNSRGVVTKDPSAGGAQERALAEKYDGLAAAVSTTHPRTARLLRRIAEGYRRDARREDFESELVEDLGV